MAVRPAIHSKPFGLHRLRAADFLRRLLFIVTLGVAVGARAADEVETELEFASRLARLGLPQYATRLLERLQVQHPEVKDRAKPVLVELKIAEGKLGVAEEMVKALDPASPRIPAIQLLLAKGYFQQGQMAKSRELYDRYFKTYESRPITDTNTYRNAAYEYGQLQERTGDLAGAVNAYERIVKLDPSGRSEEVRQVMCEQAELLVKLAQTETVVSNQQQRLATAEKICDMVIARGLDLFFGKALITKGNILGGPGALDRIRPGKRAQARKLMMDNMDILKPIDVELEKAGWGSQSPMAGARALLGDICFADARDRLKAQPPAKLADVLALLSQAMTEYINVMRKYPRSDVTPEVLLQADELNALLRSLGRPPLDLSKYTAAAMEEVFKTADDQFRADQYEQAIHTYLRVLNQIPEGEASVRALVNLMLSYANLPGPNHARLAKMTALYLIERFGQNPRAGTGLLQLAEAYNTLREREQDPQAKAADERNMLDYFALFQRYFPQHPQKGAMLYRLAFLRNQAKDEAGALKLLQQIVDELKNDPYYARALGQMAWNYYAGSNYVAAVQGFTAYVAQARPSADKAQAQLFLAISQKQVGQYREALAGFEELIGQLTPANSPYHTSPADAKKNAELLEQAVFQRGLCYTGLKEPASQIPEFRAKALQAMDDFLKAYPASTNASKVLRIKGSILLEIGKFADAARVFDELTAKYPDTEDGKSALYALARSAVEVKQYEQAKEAFRKMLAQADKFAPEYFLTMGRLFAEAKLIGEAIQAYEKAVALARKGGPVEELALYGLGQAKMTLKDYPAVVRHLTALFAKYPNTGYFYEGKFTLAEAAREAGQYPVAKAALDDVLRQAAKPVQRVRATCEMGQLQIKQGEKSTALGTYQLVAQLEDPKNQDLAPWIEQAVVASVRLASELKRYDIVLQNCELYEKNFHEGKHLDEIRKARNEAKFQTGSS